MNYLAIALNHFKTVQSWLKSANAEGSLDISSFELEVRCRNRYYKLFPQFIAEKQRRYIYEPNLTSDSFGFIGWLPYRSISWALSNDKLTFKKFMQQNSERTPDFWTDPSQASSDYILKRSMGSFGDDLAGPFHASDATSAQAAAPPGSRGTPFAEEFIKGDILKVWFWGSQPFYAQRKRYPEIQGDGSSALHKLIEEHLALCGRTLAGDDPDHATLLSTIRYQRFDLKHIPTKGERIWLDYRYGRNYTRGGLRTTSDNAIPNMSAQLKEQIHRAGKKLAEELDQQFPAPVLFSLDAVVDSDEQVWWLEMNSNPTLPPDGYPVIFASLFGTAIQAVEPAAKTVIDNTAPISVVKVGVPSVA